MSQLHRSDCPINRAVELLGDRWSLLVLRDIVFRGHTHFRALLDGSDERISPSILSDRLQTLVDGGILRRESCATHRQKAIFRLTEAGEDLVPLLAGLRQWAARYCCRDGDGGCLRATAAATPGAEGETSVPSA